MKPIRFKLLFEPRDLWIGVYWDTTKMWSNDEPRKPLFLIHLFIYITIIPTLPLKITIDVQRVKKWIESQ